MCQPTIIALNGKYPTEKEDLQNYLEVERNLVQTITAFADVEIFNIFAKKVEMFFSLVNFVIKNNLIFKEYEDRTEKQRLLIERILVLIRYVFGIGTESAVSIQINHI